MQPQPSAIIVSGGSRGLGLTIVEDCLRRGTPVATFARRTTPELEALAARHGDQLFFECLDAAHGDALEGFVGRVVKQFGGLHGLVNNAAIGQDHLLAQMPTDLLDTLLTVNLRAPLLLTRAVIRRLLLNPAGGRIVNVTSICATRGYAGLTVYSATKGAMEAFTRSLAREVGSRGILVNAVAPGFFPSAMSSVLLTEQLERIRRRTPTERLCVEQDLLPVIRLLLYEPTNLTGQTLTVDGGASI